MKCSGKLRHGTNLFMLHGEYAEIVIQCMECDDSGVQKRAEYSLVCGSGNT